VPITNRDPKVVLHSLAQDQSIGLIDLESEVVGGIDSPESDSLRHIRKEID
jgi:hypothetical protein